MKQWLSPRLLPLTAAVALSASLSAHAAEISYNAPGSGGWQVAGNWAGGILPGAGDVAQIGNATPGTGILSMNLGHASYEPKGSIWAGAIVMLSERTTALTIQSNTNRANSLYLDGVTLHGVSDTIFANESAANLTFNATSGGGSNVPIQLVLVNNADHVIQARGAGDITINAPFTGSGSSVSIYSTGSGSVFLSGANNHTGGTILRQGQLILTSATAAGTGTLTLQSGTARVNAGLAFSNTVKLTSASASYERLYTAAEHFSNFSAGSDLGARNVEARLLGGQASSARTLTASFSSSSSASNDALRLSDTLNLTGADGELFVLELALSDLALGSAAYLGWFDGSEWVNATDENSALGSLAIEGFTGSFADSGAQATADYLGSWGYDLANQSVWAILDHQSSFAVVAIPEPGSLLLLGGGLGFLALYGAKRNRRRPYTHS